ncbi:SDR family oxidoreductase [Hymenobacter setariae]|uniref:SDR family oxidoreductase n=1 Tax=Hymenobacter setariae TaxID=2594794 RepID=A0A558BS72_9BACT|nr:SDR family oxidoreductase [Hymenobacter setariae]TVT39325.1 SDR family oxidoreductase [Hymenobacter setariae]
MQVLAQKIILITGASRGIGAAIARQLAAAGASVIINYAGRQAEADQTVQTIRAAGGEALAVRADVSQPAQVARLFEESLAHYGHLDGLVNNAGIMLTKPVQATTDEDFTRQFDVNVRGTFNTLREAATRMADGGSIVNFSSSVVRVALPTYGTYVATKAAVEQLTRVFAKEVGARGINVNCVAPGPTNTELFTQGKPAEAIARAAAFSAFNRLGEPDDIAHLVSFLLTDAAKWVNGQIIGANGGMA